MAQIRVEHIAHVLIINATVVGSIPNRANELFSLLRSGNKTRSGVEVRYPPGNISKTPISLCNIRDTV